MTERSRAGHEPAVVAALLAVYAALVAAMSPRLDPTQWGALDAELFHLPQVNWFIEWGLHWDYPAWSATGPGLHWLLAGMARLTGTEALDQQSWQTILLPALLGAVALLFLHATLRSIGATPLRALVAGVPLVSSSYFWTPALHPVSESLSMVGFFAMAWALSARPQRPLAFGLAAAAATVARQNFLSCAGAYGLMALVQRWPRIWSWRLVGLAVPTLGPALVVLAALVVHWGGLTPPEWREMHTGFSLGPVLHGLMLLGLFGWLFLRREDLAGDRRALIRGLAVSVAVALVLWILVPEDGGARPNSVVWKAAAFLPAFGGRPVLTLPLLAAGLVVAGCYWRRGRRDGFRLSPELSLFACYFVSQAAQTFSWQRYAEIPVLLFLCMGMARQRERSPVHDALTLTAFAVYFLLTVWRMTDFG